MSSPHYLRIRGLAVRSAVGKGPDDWCAALARTEAPVSRPDELNQRPVFKLAPNAEALVESLARDPEYRKLDRVTLLALTAARSTLSSITKDTQVGCVTVGSSRGPTQALERTYDSFVREEARVPLLTSPVTTAGNIASWVAQSCLLKGDAGNQQPVASVSTSTTCSSAFHSLLVAMSFMKAKLAQACLFGGTEACLTPYTLAQLEALRIYTGDRGDWPCRPFSSESSGASWVTLGEAAGTALLLPASAPVEDGDMNLLGLGWAMEEIPSATGISDDGLAFQRAMTMAASTLAGRRVDAVIAHAPGSLKGDRAELQAIRAAYGDAPVYTTKHLTGHTYGASGMVSLGLAQALLGAARWSGMPYPSVVQHRSETMPPRVIAINTAGFGGNAITAIVARPD